MQVAVLGLTNNGKLIVEKLLASGHEIVVWDRSKELLDAIRIEKAEFIVSQKLNIVHSLDEMQNFLRKPRIIWSLQQVGEPTETTLSQLHQYVESGDVVIDGATTNFKDTNRHSGDFENKGVKFLGIGIAGGVHALESGACLMVGGNAEAYQYIAPILDNLASPDGVHNYFGIGGAGHFVKMVHDGIEYGMIQAISEGLGVLSKSEYKLDIGEVADTWQDGAIVSSFLLDMVIDASVKDPSFSQFDGNIPSDPSVKWTIDQAKLSNLPVPAIEQSFEFRTKSSYDKLVQDTIIAKIVQAMKREIDGNS